MFAEAATSDTAGASTNATMHATSTKQVLQAGVFDEAERLYVLWKGPGTHSRDCFVWDFRIRTSFRLSFRVHCKSYEVVTNVVKTRDPLR